MRLFPLWSKDVTKADFGSDRNSRVHLSHLSSEVKVSSMLLVKVISLPFPLINSTHRNRLSVLYIFSVINVVF